MITHYSVGGYPRIYNNAFWVVCHPAGTKRWCWTSAYRDEIIANFEQADEATVGLDFHTVSERVAFEIALFAIEKDSYFEGNLFENNRRVDY